MHISIQFKQIILAGILTSTLLQASALEDGNNAAQKGHMKTALKPGLCNRNPIKL